MMIADQCRSLAARCYAASVDPWTPPSDQTLAKGFAHHYETMAAELDRLNILTATGADLAALTLVYFGESLSSEEAARRLA